ncbi:transaldolase family protein [Anaerobium acetethylicum]|uniref:Transaldolase n=1 Tax=Anaerobium acetethylicum TaxID=1619234 RepID=A0A1D3TW39_9FIRM|nr:transaldolase family protein [Anaerobium acetethylicum]SCP98407.1 Transaldolase [Anaerobium acetethylicum]
MTTEIRSTISTLGLPTVRGEEGYLARVKDFPITLDLVKNLKGIANFVGVTPKFKEVIDYFNVAEGETPAGFKVEFELDSENVLRADLVRNISYDKNGQKRPTNLLFSADSANPYEVAPIKNLLANLTCNPGIIYDLFINNPKANIGNQFKTRDEVMSEIGKILGPGADISVELNDPFGKSDAEILEEAARFKELLSEHRVVIKVPHTGPVNKDNVKELLTGDKKFSKKYNDVSTADALRGHNMALMLHEHGYRVNFTLMFEPYQTALALQARPYFINSFIRHRLMQSVDMKNYLDLYAVTKEIKYLEALKSFMVDKDFLPVNANVDLSAVKAKAEQMLKYRNFDNKEGSDGLDGVRHNLRLLRQTNMEDTRLILCSMEGDDNYPDIDRLLASDEYGDMAGRVVLTAEPNYLAQFTTTNQVVTYQRRFMNAANGAQ